MRNDKSRDLANYRLDRAKEMIKDAKQLAEAGSYKSGNNRAYYAIFHAMRAVLALEGIDFKRHSGVIQYFQKEYIKPGKFEKSYSDIIMAASEIRNASDYDDFFLASKEETSKQINDAESFISVVENYLHEPTEK